MLKSILAVAANRIIIDAKTQQISIIDVFEGISAHSFPIIIPKLSFLFLLEKDIKDGDKKELIFLYFIDEKKPFTFPTHVYFRGKKTTRAIIEFEGFMIPNHGKLTVKLQDGETVLDELYFDINQLDIPQPRIKDEHHDKA